MRDIRLDPYNDLLRAVTRRHLFRQSGFGIGAAALTSLLGQPVFAAENPLAPKPPMFAAKLSPVPRRCTG